MGFRTRSRWRAPQAVLVAALLAVLLPLPAARAAGGDYRQTLDITFPTDPRASFTDSYDACRDGCSRRHKATDIMGQKMWREYATVDGVICGLDEGPEDSWGRHLTLCGDDGHRYRYLHINNDTPGTDDGQAPMADVYAPGIRKGLRVARGQFLAYMGDSGNAEGTAPHLHLDVFDDTVTDPYGDHRIDAYAGLKAALARGDIADGSAFYADPADRIAGSDRIGTAVALSETTFDHADVVVVAAADAPHATLVAGPLAAVLRGPVLTVFPGRLDPRVLDEIRRLGASSVVVVGAVDLPASAFTPAGIASDAVTTINGGDRYTTAALVARRVWDLEGATGTVAGLDAAPVTENLDAMRDGSVPASPLLVVTDTPDRSDLRHLDGAVTSTNLYVALEGVVPDQVEAVAFLLDDARRPVQVERRYPYDLGGTGRGDRPNPVRVGDLGPGAHTLRAVVRHTDGTTEIASARFAVAQGLARRAVVALGDHTNPARAWPDALMASWYGSTRGMPVLLVSPASLTAPTAAALDGVAEVVVAGGTAAIPADHLAQIDRIAGQVSRLWGRTRYSTATAMADDLLTRGIVDPTQVWAATGLNWPDALTAGPAVSAEAGVLVLLDGAAGGGDTETTSFLASHALSVERGEVIGGQAAVSTRALTNLRRSIT